MESMRTLKLDDLEYLFSKKIDKAEIPEPYQSFIKYLFHDFVKAVKTEMIKGIVTANRDKIYDGYTFCEVSLLNHSELNTIKKDVQILKNEKEEIIAAAKEKCITFDPTCAPCKVNGILGKQDSQSYFQILQNCIDDFFEMALIDYGSGFDIETTIHRFRARTARIIHTMYTQEERNERFE